MKQLCLLITIAFSLLITPAFAGDLCVLTHPLSKLASASDNLHKQQTDKTAKGEHCCCQHYEAMRLPTNTFTIQLMQASNSVPIPADSKISSISVRPLLEPPSHV